MITFDFTPPGEHKTFLAVGAAAPARRHDGARPSARCRRQAENRADATGGSRCSSCSLVALGAGCSCSVMLAWYLSRRIARRCSSCEGRRRGCGGQLRRRGSERAGSGRGRPPGRALPPDGAPGSPRPRQQERNFLMSVSHELRTPLTAIRGHAAALSEGARRGRRCGGVSLDVIAEEAERLERLVGDVLDLAKLDAHRFTVLQRGGRHGAPGRPAYTTFNEEARRRGIDYRSERTRSRDRHGRRPRASRSSRTSSRTRSAGRPTAAGSSWRSRRRTEHLGLGRGHRAGDHAGRAERIFRPFWSRDGGGTGLGLAIARELARRARRPDRARQRARRRVSRFDLVLPATPPS